MYKIQSMFKQVLKLNIYLISRKVASDDYDIFDSAVIVAATEKNAKQINPNGEINDWRSSSWVSSEDEITAVLIGKAHDSLVENTVICASFNAG